MDYKIIPLAEFHIFIKSIHPKKLGNNYTNKYLNIACAFDIETTNTVVNGQECGYMYLWSFAVGSHATYGRTWTEYIELYNNIVESWQLDNDRRVIIYVHNLAYEFQFIRKLFTWDNVFSRSPRTPICATTTDYVEYRCSYILSGLSLKNVARNLDTHVIEKLDEFFDYDLIRNASTPLKDIEIQYSCNDVLIVTSYVMELIHKYGSIQKIPKTHTGFARNYMMERCFYDGLPYDQKEERRAKKQLWHEHITRMNVRSVREQKQLISAFQGGYTHANINYVGECLTDIYSADISSSYPTVMITEKYPMSDATLVEVKDIDAAMHYMTHYCCVFEVAFENLESKFAHDNYISLSRCKTYKSRSSKYSNPNRCYTNNNGRLVHADICVTTMTNIDFEIVKVSYKWDNIKFSNFMIYTRDYLPTEIVKGILKLYNDKTKLKDIPEKEAIYKTSKELINSVYGMCVTNNFKPLIEYENDWLPIQPLTDEAFQKKIDELNKTHKRFLYYPWGIFVTAYARRRLWTAILALGDDYIYSDTDSVKYKNHEKHDRDFKIFENHLNKQLQVACEYHHININDVYPMTVKGAIKKLGAWDHDGQYKMFKTLGAKRYIYISDDDTFHVTIAGANKYRTPKYMLDACGVAYDIDHHGQLHIADYTNIHKLFDFFNDGMSIPAESSGKMCFKYIDNPTLHTVTDYQGNQERFAEHSSVYMTPISFTLSMSDEFINLIDLIKEYKEYGQMV